MIIGNLVIYIAGAAWLSKFVGWNSALSVGVLPFLAGDAIKIALATLLLPVGWKLIGRFLR
jgi:biotin transport system substrate-specific component